MKRPLKMVLLTICLCAISGAIDPGPTARAQNERRMLLEIDACHRLQIFEDGWVLETRWQKTKEWRLSDSSMRKLRKVIEDAPCIKQWRKPDTSPPDPRVQSLVPVSRNSDANDCSLAWVGYGRDLIEAKVTVSDGKEKVGPFPLYVLSERASDSEKERARSIYQTLLKPRWRKFLRDVTSITNSESILTSCGSPELGVPQR